MASLRGENETARENMSSQAVFTSEDLDSPFASGAFRWVAKGKYTNGPRNGEKCVCKWFKSGVVYESTYYEKDVKAIAKAMEIIREFNNSGIIDEQVQLNQADVWTFREGSKWDGHKVLQEPFIKRWQKFNSNTGWCNGREGWPEKMQALSHFSYHITQGQFLLCDLQGGVTETGIVLTDPVILSRAKAYGVTDLGSSGISTFFARHKCGSTCRTFWQVPSDQRASFDSLEGTSMVSMGAAGSAHDQMRTRKHSRGSRSQSSRSQGSCSQARSYSSSSHLARSSRSAKSKAKENRHPDSDTDSDDHS